MQSTRMTRLAHQFQQEIAMIIHQELKDPSLGFVTITRVELTNDLRHAKVLYGCLGDEAERARSQDALDRSTRFVYGLLKKRFRLKAIPELAFRYDASIEASIVLSNTLDELNQEQGG